MKLDKIKLLVMFTVFMDILGFGIVIPVLPFYVERFSGSPLTVTTLFSVFALCSFISSPLIGALSDRYGRRPALMASIASTAAGWFIFAAAPTLWLLYLGRIVDGLAAGNLPVAQSAMVDLAKDDRERTANLGQIGAVFGIGFIAYPMINIASNAPKCGHQHSEEYQADYSGNACPFCGQSCGPPDQEKEEVKSSLLTGIHRFLG